MVLPENILEVRELRKTYGAHQAVDIRSLDVREGEFFTIVGPSGCGKSTLLGMLTGAVDATAGEIRIAGKDVTHLPAASRPTAMVFQSLALFPHLTVGENIEFPMKIAGRDRSYRKSRTEQLLSQLRLPHDYHGKKIGQCSGGERQRVAIARALAYDPDILFFDEPLSAIDYRLRKTLQVELTDIHRRTGKTFVLVTHSIEEAMAMSDRVALMRQGRIVQIGRPGEIYLTPANRFVADFLGDTNVFEIIPGSGNRNRARMRVGGREQEVVLPQAPASSADHRYLIVRPENMRILEGAEHTDNELGATIEHSILLGSRIQYHARAGEQMLTVERFLENSPSLNIGDAVRIGWDRSSAHMVGQ